jgi:hypothetical protein
MSHLSRINLGLQSQIIGVMPTDHKKRRWIATAALTYVMHMLCKYMPYEYMLADIGHAKTT